MAYAAVHVLPKRLLAGRMCLVCQPRVATIRSCMNAPHLLVLLRHHLLKDGWQGVDHVLGHPDCKLAVVQDIFILKLQQGQTQLSNMAP